jgi:hypothetical protein
LAANEQRHDRHGEQDKRRDQVKQHRGGSQYDFHNRNDPP